MENGLRSWLLLKSLGQLCLDLCFVLWHGSRGFLLFPCSVSKNSTQFQLSKDPLFACEVYVYELQLVKCHSKSAIRPAPQAVILLMVSCRLKHQPGVAVQRQQFLPRRQLLQQVEVRGLWHFWLWQIMESNDNVQLLRLLYAV